MRLTVLASAVLAAALTGPLAWATQEDTPVPGDDPNPGVHEQETEPLDTPPPAPPGRLGAIAHATRQPQGALTGRLVYCSAGHGWTFDIDQQPTDSGYPSDLVWFTQRGDYYEIVEDLQNQDQLTMFVDYLWNAGATIVPFRPIGRQPHEVVMDNDSPEAVFAPAGSWSSNTTTTPYYGESGDVRYRAATKSATETATATYTPNLPEAGFYPVYSWVREGTNRVQDQLYRINHAGGATEVRVNHRRVGRGWVYLGTYFFNAGTGGSVVISNQSSDPLGTATAIIADAIRFGNGMGDIDRGSGVSSCTREEEASRYWIQREIGFGGDTTNYDRASSSDQNDNVGAPIRQAVDMNVETDGVMTDRVYIGFHTDAGAGSKGLYNGNNDPDSETPNQFRLAELIGREVNDDLVALNSQLEVTWVDAGPLPSDVTLDRSDIEFGEINNTTINDEFDATIIESGAHGDADEALNLRNPNVRNWIARASYQSVVRYFNEFGGGPLVFLPEPPSNVRAVSSGAGGIIVSWSAPPSGAPGGDVATGYVVYRSTNGYGFDAGTTVSGGGTTSLTVTGIPADQVTYFRVAATNAGGESMPSETVVCRRRASGPSPILIVNGFDRFARSQNVRQTAGPGIGSPTGGTQTFDRVRPRYNNSFDYVIQIAEAIEPYLGLDSQPRAFDSCQNEAITGGQVLLSNYSAVFWILGEESTGDETFSAAEQTLVQAYVANAGHNLFVSGAELAYDLDSQGSVADRNFINNVLRTDYIGDDAATYSVAAAAAGIFAGNAALSFDDGVDFDDNLVSQYNTDYPDRLAPLGSGALAAMTYSGGLGGTAAIQYDGSAGGGRLVVLGFPFETITSESARLETMRDVLEFFVVPLPVELSGFMAN